MRKKIFFFFFVVILFLSSAFGAEIGRFEVVSGNGENAYLVDTATGFVWILTYRTLPTGREPIAIPYKFIVITPQNEGTFLVETIPMMEEPKKEEK